MNNPLPDNMLDILHSGMSFFFYKGSFMSQPGVIISSLIEEKISSLGSKKIRKRALFFIIEIVQNIEKYTADKKGCTDWFQLSLIGQDLLIQSQNKISNDGLEKLKSHLEKVTQGSKEEVDELFYERLESSIDSDKKSPGLGLIEMRRRNKKAFRYGFERIDENSSYFNLELVVSEDIDEFTDDIYQRFNRIRSLFGSSDGTVCYVGEINKKILSPMIHLIENLKFTTNPTVVSRYQHCIIEKIQNAREHGRLINDHIPGFFMLEKHGNSIYTHCMNACDDSASLIRKTDFLNDCSDEELKQESKNAMMNMEDSGGLGMIQIAMYSRPSPLLSKSILHPVLGDFFYLSSDFTF